MDPAGCLRETMSGRTPKASPSSLESLRALAAALHRTLRWTNPSSARNVKRWGGGKMTLRGTASALADTNRHPFSRFCTLDLTRCRQRDRLL
jgi:hypothetical protein